MEYDRKILAPYLTELYGIEVTYHTLKSKNVLYAQLIDAEKHNLSKAHKLNIHMEKSSKSPLSDKNPFLIFTTFAISIIIAIILCYFVSQIMLIRIFLEAFEGLIILLFLFLLWCTASLIAPYIEKKVSYRNNKIHQQNATVDALEKEKTIIRKSQELLPLHEQIQAEIINELNTCRNIRFFAYNTNIIPVQYRNLGSIAYLYEYFSTSRATDLDQVIQTMLLDDVRQRIQNIENRLNQIISNQQRIYEKLSDIQQTASYISRQMNSIELSLNEQIRNSQEQTEQLKMIKTNTEISNYLQLGTYLKIARY